MSEPVRIIFCQCANARIISSEVKEQVRGRLQDAGVAVEVVADLCELAGRRDPALKGMVEEGDVRIAACYPRAVRWLFAAGGVELPVGVKIGNMRAANVEQICSVLMEAGMGEGHGRAAHATVDDGRAAHPTTGWRAWFPVIDFGRCTNCMQCLSFCLFDVFGVGADRKITVQKPANCKTDCPACSRVCPEVAIIFPKYRLGPINGEEVNAEDLRRQNVKVDVSALLGGDVYGMLRDRNARTQSRFSRERDEGRAMEERRKCLAKLQEQLDIPDQVVAKLTGDDVLATNEPPPQPSPGVPGEGAGGVQGEES